MSDLVHDRPQLRIRLTAVVNNLSLVRRGLRTWLDTLDWPDSERTMIVTAVNEACTNTVRHAYVEGQPGNLTMTADMRANDILRYVHIVIADHGRWREPSAAAGRACIGLMLITACVERLDIHQLPNGTRVELTSRPVPLNIP